MYFDRFYFNQDDCWEDFGHFGHVAGIARYILIGLVMEKTEHQRPHNETMTLTSKQYKLMKDATLSNILNRAGWQKL